MLLINADDLGRNQEITDRILSCYRHNKIHSASAMTFMEDSERASELSNLENLPVGLHLNFTLNFTGKIVNSQLRLQQNRIVKYLNAHKYNQLLYNPYLTSAFEYVFNTQWDEYCRLFNETPKRLDGHHHMHLCMNMLLSRLYPKGIMIRRNFTFHKGDKNILNRMYRYFIDLWLSSHFTCTDSFFSIVPINRERIKKLALLSKSTNVELMVHPGLDDEYSFLFSPFFGKLFKEFDL